MFMAAITMVIHRGEEKARKNIKRLQQRRHLKSRGRSDLPHKKIWSLTAYDLQKHDRDLNNVMNGVDVDVIPNGML